MIRWAVGPFLFLHLVACSEFSPGDLTEAHASLEGSHNCARCHSPGEPMGDAKCLGCHSVVAELVRADRGYHASSEAKNRRCLECHSEHHGRGFQIVHFNPEEFDHGLAKYRLQGKHRNLSCTRCHKAEFISDEKLKKKSGTYLGLERRCLSCHDGYHEDDTGEDCLECHSFDSFSEM